MVVQQPESAYNVKNQSGTKLRVTSQRQAIAQALEMAVDKECLKLVLILMSHRVDNLTSKYRGSSVQFEFQINNKSLF